MIDTTKLNGIVFRDIKEASGLSKEKISQLTTQETFNYWCTWQGFINWGEIIVRAYESIKESEISNAKA